MLALEKHQKRVFFLKKNLRVNWIEADRPQKCIYLGAGENMFKNSFV